MSIPQRSRLTNNQKLTLIEESQQPGFKIEDATITQMRLAIALEHYQIKLMSLAGMHISVKNHSAASTVNKNSLQMMKTI